MANQAHPTAVGMFHAPADQIHDGFALAAYLNSLGLGCALRRFWSGTPRGLALEELTGAANRLMLLSVGEENLEQTLRLAEPLSRRREVVLFGRQLHDPDLREEALAQGVSAVVVGDPRPVCRDLARRLGQGEASVEDVTLAGLFLPGVEGTPREPTRHLDGFPAGDYTHEATQVALAVPLRGSMGFPFPATNLAERVWESPLRGVSPGRTAETIGLHVAAHGARRFLFTDLAANAAGDDLNRLAELLVEQGFGHQVRWYATVWADPALDRRTLNLLRRAGCRGLRLHVWTGSPRISRELGLGVDQEVALRICRDAALEGIDLRPLIQIGFPGEEEADRQATNLWLAQAAGDLRAVDQLSPCSLRGGAPLRRSGAIYFPLDSGARGWHDGGENNDSQRGMWVREARTVCGVLGLDHPGRAGRQFSAMTEPAVRRRLTGNVDQGLAGSASWRRRWLHLAGVLHGREAFCGPLELQLDVGGDSGMELERALDMAEQAANMGTRILALGQADAPVELDAASWPDIHRLLERARELDLQVVLRSRLPGLDAAMAETLSDGVHGVELTCATPQELEGLREPVAAMANRRTAHELILPRLKLTAWLSASLPSPAALVEAARDMGVDTLVLAIKRSAEAQLSAEGVAAAHQELAALSEGALDRDEAQDLLRLDRQGPGWPQGFVLTARSGGSLPACRCPADRPAREVHDMGALPGALLVRYDEQGCQLCQHLDACPVSRLDFSVTLLPLQVMGAAALAQDLQDEDLGLGRAARTAERRPCLAGWESARITADGDLFLCPVCGVESVGNVVEEGLAGVWYSRALNEFRRMSVGASLALPFIDRNRCAMGCGRGGQDQHLINQIRALSKEQLAALESAGSGDRLW